MENYFIRHRGALAAFALAPVLLVSPLAHAALDVVKLDVSSGSLDEPLPFDVPFVVTGRAPAGTFRVRLQYEMASEVFPAVPLESGVNADGEFRIRVPAIEPNRELSFQLVFERRLSRDGADAFRRDVTRILDAGLRGGVADGSRLLARIHRALELAVNGGAPMTPTRGEVTLVEAPEAKEWCCWES